MGLGKQIIKECPISLIEPASVSAWDLFYQCHSVVDGGIMRTGLPKSGGVLGQDNLTMQMFTVIEQEQREVTRERIKKLTDK